jgi:hypothetical protein
MRPMLTQRLLISPVTCLILSDCYRLCVLLCTVLLHAFTTCCVCCCAVQACPELKETVFDNLKHAVPYGEPCIVPQYLHE